MKYQTPKLELCSSITKKKSNHSNFLIKAVSDEELFYTQEKIISNFFTQLIIFPKTVN